MGFFHPVLLEAPLGHSDLDHLLGVLVLTIKRQRKIPILTRQILVLILSPTTKDLDLKQAEIMRIMSTIKTQMELMLKTEAELLLFFLSWGLILFQILVMVSILLKR